MDDLFLLPRAPVAMPRAYWALPSLRTLTSLFILLEPSEVELERLITAAKANTRKDNEYDMEILNNMYSDSAMVLPHRQYGLLSGEFRLKDHKNYLGNDYEAWDPDRALRDASLVHFSDWPIPKPWIMWPRNLLQLEMPRCKINPGTAGEVGCRDRDIWMELYNDFRRRRKVSLVVKVISQLPNFKRQDKTERLCGALIIGYLCFVICPSARVAPKTEDQWALRLMASCQSYM